MCVVLKLPQVWLFVVYQQIKIPTSISAAMEKLAKFMHQKLNSQHDSAGRWGLTGSNEVVPVEVDSLVQQQVTWAGV